MKEKIKNSLLVITAVILCIGGLLVIPATIFAFAGWFVFNDIHMNYRAWILIGVLTLGILNYIGFRRQVNTPKINLLIV